MSEDLAKATGLTFDYNRRLQGSIINIASFTKEEKHFLQEDVYGYEKMYKGFQVYCWYNFFENVPYIQPMVLILDVKVIDSEEIKKAVEDATMYFSKYEETK